MQLRRRYLRIKALLPPCQVLCDCQAHLQEQGFIGSGKCPHGKTVYGSLTLTMEQWNTLARETLSSHGTPQLEASEVDALRKAPAPQQTPAQLAKINAAAAEFYAAWSEGKEYSPMIPELFTIVMFGALLYLIILR